MQKPGFEPRQRVAFGKKPPAQAAPAYRDTAPAQTYREPPPAQTHGDAAPAQAYRDIPPARLKLFVVGALMAWLAYLSGGWAFSPGEAIQYGRGGIAGVLISILNLGEAPMRFLTRFTIFAASFSFCLFLLRLATRPYILRIRPDGIEIVQIRRHFLRWNEIAGLKPTRAKARVILETVPGTFEKKNDVRIYAPAIKGGKKKLTAFFTEFLPAIRSSALSHPRT